MAVRAVAKKTRPWAQARIVAERSHRPVAAGRTA